MIHELLHLYVAVEDVRQEVLVAGSIALESNWNELIYEFTS